MLSHEFNLNLSKLNISFINFASYELFGNWMWKLDPWVKRELSELNIIVNKSSNSIVPEKKQLLFEENRGFFKLLVHRSKDNGTIWTMIRKAKKEVYLCYYVNSNWNHVTLLEDKTETQGRFAFEYFGFIFPSIALKNDFLTFHGVLMEHNGNGIIISAESGTGKTTHARLWRDKKNALIINGDRSFCYKENGVWTGYGFPWSGSSGEQINRSVQIKAIVVLERGKENQANLLDLHKTFPFVLPHVLYPNWDGELVGKAMELLDDFLTEIPVVRLICSPNEESVEVLNKVLEELEK